MKRHMVLGGSGLLFSVAIGCGKGEPPKVVPTAPLAATVQVGQVDKATTAAAPDVVAATAEVVPPGTTGTTTAPEAADAGPATTAAGIPDGGEAAAPDAPPVPVVPVVPVEPKTPDQVCDELAAKNKAVLGKLAEDLAAARARTKLKLPFAALPAFPGCVGDAGAAGADGKGPRTRGTWAIAVERASVEVQPGVTEDSPDAAKISISAPVVWVAADGTTSSLVPLSDGDNNVTLGLETHVFSFDRLADFDGDGQPELVVKQEVKQPDSHATPWFEVYRVVAGKVEQWEVQPTIAGLEDIDGDGVLDFLHADTFKGGSGMNDVAAEGLNGVTHVVGGKLQTDDAAVKAYYKKACPTRLTAANIKGGSQGSVIKQAGCAWLWGEKPAAITAKVNALLNAKVPVDAQSPWEGPWADPDGKPPTILE